MPDAEAGDLTQGWQATLNGGDITMRTLAERLSLIQVSATVGLADAAATLRRQGIRVVDLHIRAAVTA